MQHHFFTLFVLGWRLNFLQNYLWGLEIDVYIGLLVVRRKWNWHCLPSAMEFATGRSLYCRIAMVLGVYIESEGYFPMAIPLGL